LAEALCIPKKNGAHAAGTQTMPPSNLVETFLSQMNVYRAYWRNDPVFDMTNTLSVAGHIPCPVMDKEQMRTLTNYAIRANFGWPRPKPAVLDFDPEQALHLSNRETLFSSFPEPTKELQMGLRIVGAGGGDWKIRLLSSSGDKKTIYTERGIPSAKHPVARMNVVLFKQLLEGKLDLHTLACGDIAWENTNDLWIKQYGNELLDKIVKR
jgi:hypothetical protein